MQKKINHFDYIKTKNLLYYKNIVSKWKRLIKSLKNIYIFVYIIDKSLLSLFHVG